VAKSPLPNLAALERRLRLIDVPGYTAVVGQTMLQLVDETFRTRSDPNGVPWAPRKDDKPHPLLEEFGPLRAGYYLRSTPNTTSLANSQPYAALLNGGTSRMVARPMLPRGRLPEAWRARIHARVQAKLGRDLRGFR
jgi:phage gpG-like protein